ncbi:MAG TPA: AMP-binding protein [Catenuloplanes sp.]
MTVLPHPDARLVDGQTGVVLAGAALRAAVDAAAAALAALPPGLVVALMPSTVDAVLGYLGALSARRPVALLDPALPADVLHDLVGRYRPAVVTGVGDHPSPPGYTADRCEPPGPIWRAATPAGTGPTDTGHPDLGLLLATSGSTGSPRLVRLSRRGLLANVVAVTAALGITADEVTVTSLPLYYTYGLTVLNTHLSAGATVVLDRRGLLDRDFWATVGHHRVTSLAAVPYQYEMLSRIRFDPAAYPSLRTLTQAGGRLRRDLVVDFHQRMRAHGGELVVMYGQTEAGRMAILPPGRLPDRADSAGAAIPGGRFSVGAGDEIVYHGPNVMMGYASSAADLARGDELGGVLATGDVGRLDADGLLYLTGRTQRFSKVFGVRISLDDVERMLQHRGAVAAVGGDDRIVVWAEGAPSDRCAEIRRELSGRIGLHSSGFAVRGIDHLPLLSSGKVDYRALQQRG